LFAGSAPEERMLDAVRKVRAAGIRTGLISNSWGTRRYPRELFGELFDGVVISAEVGIRKPSPEIYTLGAQRIGLEPAACVFVDDLPFNLAPAAELGMGTVHHRATDATLLELERLLGVSIR
jgi:putative hydrolase of the HAD superfamily